MWYIITRIRRDREAESSVTEQRAFLGKEVFRAKRCSGDSGTKFKPFKHPCNCCFALVSIFSVNFNFQRELLDMPAITQARKGQEVQSLNHRQKPGCIFLALPSAQPGGDTAPLGEKHKQGPSDGGPHRKPAPGTFSRGPGAPAPSLPPHWDGNPEPPFSREEFGEGSGTQHHSCGTREPSSDASPLHLGELSPSFLLSCFFLLTTSGENL